MSSCDFAIIGAGITGLATADALARKNPSAKITVFEKEPAPGLHASGRNSGVIHSGIYYSPGTLKAALCVSGGERMRNFALESGAPIKKTGKVIIATREEDLPTLDILMGNARAAGIEAELMDDKGIMKIEPLCRPYKAGIHIPGVCVVEAKAVVDRLAERLKRAGVTIMYGEKTLSANPDASQIVTSNGAYRFGMMYNCAGAYADVVARWFGVGENYRLTPFKGIYRKLASEKAKMINGAIYPAPDLGFPFLGVHFTTSTNGTVYIGPTAIPALGRENYSLTGGLDAKEAVETGALLLRLFIANKAGFRRLVREELGRYGKNRFLEAARRLVPSISEGDLEPSAKVGIRPQLVDTKEGRMALDYVILRKGNTVHALNAISPAFTSAFAFADFMIGGGA